MQEPIISLQNSKIKNITLLQEKSRERSKQGLFPVEGLREIERAIASGFEISSLYTCDSLPCDLDILDIDDDKIFPVSRKVFEKLAYRENSDGVLALFKTKTVKLPDLQLRDKPLIVVLEGVEKPGNLGAILRTADAAGVDALVVCDPKCDIYNPNVVRSSLGCLFSVPVVTCTSEEALDWLKINKITSNAAELEASVVYDTVDYTVGSAIVLGTEDKGLSKFWIDNADRRIIIPMCGIADSLNVSVSAAVIVFEACRQRKFK